MSSLYHTPSHPMMRRHRVAHAPVRPRNAGRWATVRGLSRRERATLAAAAAEFHAAAPRACFEIWGGWLPTRTDAGQLALRLGHYSRRGGALLCYAADGQGHPSLTGELAVEYLAPGHAHGRAVWGPTCAALAEIPPLPDGLHHVVRWLARCALRARATAQP